MKKLILLAFFSGILLQSIAQSDSSRITPIIQTAAYSFPHKEYRFTISATPLISWMSTDTRNISSAGARAGIGGGIMVEKNFTQNVAFCFGMHVTQMGGKIKYDSLVVNVGGNGSSAQSFRNVEYAYKTRYVELPAMIKMRTDEFGYSRVYFEAGLALGLLWRGRADVSQNIFTNSQGGNEDRNINDGKDDFYGNRSVVNEDNVRGLRIPLIVGGGWEYALTQNTVAFLGLRYSGGLFNTLSANNTKAFTNYFGLNIGVMF
jgi:hypothetical protein